MEKKYVFLYIMFLFIIMLSNGLDALVYEINTDKTKYIIENIVRQNLLLKREMTETLNTISKMREESLDSLKHAILILQPNLDQDLVNEYVEAIDQSSQKYGLPPELVACIIMKESGFNPNAKGPSLGKERCQGSMQIRVSVHMDKIRKRGISVNEANYIKNNVDIGCEILREYYDRSGGNIKLALTKYVGGANHGSYVKDILQKYAELTIWKQESIKDQEKQTICQKHVIMKVKDS